MAKVSENELYKKLSTIGHKHFCSNRDCRAVYDCLEVPFLHYCNSRQNGRCQKCAETSVPIWFDAQQQQKCCAHNVRQITDRDELLAHRLAGPGPWFKCKTCARCLGWPQGFNTNNS